MATREDQAVRYWPTPQACAALGGHRPDDLGVRCLACNTALLQLQAVRTP